MANRLQIRRDTAQQWEAVNPILREGEPAYILDGGRVIGQKIGDGVSAWNDLPEMTPGDGGGGTGGGDIPAGSITSSKLAAGAVTNQKIADGAVTAIKIAAGAVTADKIAAGALPNANLIKNSGFVGLAGWDVVAGEAADLGSGSVVLYEGTISQNITLSDGRYTLSFTLEDVQSYGVNTIILRAGGFSQVATGTEDGLFSEVSSNGDTLTLTVRTVGGVHAYRASFTVSRGEAFSISIQGGRYENIFSKVKLEKGDAATAWEDVVTFADVEEMIDEVETKIVSRTESVATIQPNVLNVWGEVASLDIALAEPTDNTIVNEYMVQFASGATATTLTLPSGIKWLSKPSIEANTTYQISIVNNLAVIGGFKDE